MAELKPKKIVLSEINNGQQIENGDGVQPNLFNAPVEASAYAQALATTQPNLENVNNFGIPSVSIEEADGLPRFKFENLNAVEIVSVEQTVSSTESGAENVMTVTLNNGEVKNFPFYNGVTGAKLVSRVLQGQDQDGGNIYLDTFDDGTTAYFTAPKGNKGDTYVLTEDDKTEIAEITAPLSAPLVAPLTEPYVDKVVENEIHEQMVEATKGFTVIENVSNLVESNISFTKNYVSYNKLNDYVTLRLVGTANSLNATSSVNVATMSDIFAPNAETQKEVSVGGIKTIFSVGTDGSITFSGNNILNGDFDVEITWELPSDSVIGHLELQAVQTVNINSVVRKGDITTINLDATFENQKVVVQKYYSASTTLFYISDAFGVQHRKFSCECDYVLSNGTPGKRMLNFEIQNGDCRTRDNPFNQAAYIVGVHNLQLKFDAEALVLPVYIPRNDLTTSNISFSISLEVDNKTKLCTIRASGSFYGGNVRANSFSFAYLPIAPKQDITIRGINDNWSSSSSYSSAYLVIKASGEVILYASESGTTNFVNQGYSINRLDGIQYIGNM